MNRNISNGLKIIAFLLLIIIADQVIGLVLRKLYLNQKTGNNQSLTYTLRDCKADVLIFGASQAQHNYDPKIIGDSLNMSCYNAGQDGGHSILLPYAQIKVILSRYTPKIIIVEIGDYQALEYSIGDYERLSILEPYYFDFPELRPLILLRGPYEQFKLLSGIYPYNSKIISLIRLNTDFDKNRKWIFSGYIPIKDKVLNVSKLKPIESSTAGSRIDDTKVMALNNIIDLCKMNQVKLYFVISPHFESIQNHLLSIPESQRLLAKIVNSKKIALIDLKDYKYFLDNSNLFADQSHLNENGATKYSQIIGGLLKKQYTVKL